MVLPRIVFCDFDSAFASVIVVFPDFVFDCS